MFNTIHNWLKSRKEDRSAWMDEEHDLQRASATVSMKDGRKFEVVRYGFMYPNCFSGHGVMLTTGKERLTDYLDECEGLLCVHGGHRVAVCEIAEVSPIKLEPHMKTFREVMAAKDTKVCP